MVASFPPHSSTSRLDDSSYQGLHARAMPTGTWYAAAVPTVARERDGAGLGLRRCRGDCRRSSRAEIAHLADTVRFRGRRPAVSCPQTARLACLSVQLSVPRQANLQRTNVSMSSPSIHREPSLEPSGNCRRFANSENASSGGPAIPSLRLRGEPPVRSHEEPSPATGRIEPRLGLILLQ
jgi:hypothetical protein